MTQVNKLYKNIIDVSQAFHNGQVLPEVGLVYQRNGLTGSVPWKECNDGTGHIIRQTIQLPVTYEIGFGEGTPESVSQAANDRVTCTILSGWSTIPRDTSLLGGAQAQLLAQEDMHFAESLQQLFGRTWIYANRNANNKSIYGLATLYGRLSGNKAANVISCGGATANAQTSAFLIDFGPRVYGIFPKGLPAGYFKHYWGPQSKTLPNGNQLAVIQTEHQWHVGIVIEDHTHVVRLCNIDVAEALALSGNQLPTSFNNFLHKLIAALMRPRDTTNLELHCNDVLYQLLLRLAFEKSNNAVKVEEAITQFGTFKELRILGVRVVRNDQILNTEQVVAA